MIMQPPQIHTHTFDKDLWYSAFGAATIVLLESERKRSEILSLGAFLLPYAKLGQISIVFARNRHPGGYITWGNLTSEGLEKIRLCPTQIPDIEDLNAGDNFVVFDIVSNLPNFRPIQQTILSLVGTQRRWFYGIRFDRQLRKLVLRRYAVRKSDRMFG